MSCGINLSDRLPLNLKQVSNNPSFLEEEEKRGAFLFVFVGRRLRGRRVHVGNVRIPGRGRASNHERELSRAPNRTAGRERRRRVFHLARAIFYLDFGGR